MNEAVERSLHDDEVEGIEEGKIEYREHLFPLSPPSPGEVLDFVDKGRRGLIVVTPERIYKVWPEKELDSDALRGEIEGSGLSKVIKQYETLEDMKNGWLGNIQDSDVMGLDMESWGGAVGIGIPETRDVTIRERLYDDEVEAVEQGKIEYREHLFPLSPPSPGEVLDFVDKGRRGLIVVTPERIYKVWPEKELDSDALRGEIEGSGLSEDIKNYEDVGKMKEGWMGKIQGSSVLGLDTEPLKGLDSSEERMMMPKKGGSPAKKMAEKTEPPKEKPPKPPEPPVRERESSRKEDKEEERLKDLADLAEKMAEIPEDFMKEFELTGKTRKKLEEEIKKENIGPIQLSKIRENVKTVVAYHGTSSRFRKLIEEKGFVPSSKTEIESAECMTSIDYENYKHRVYFATDKKAAKIGLEGIKKYGGEPLCFKVRLNPNRLEADEDARSDDTIFFSFQNIGSKEWLKSCINNRTFAHNGTVPPKNIERIYNYDEIASLPTEYKDPTPDAWWDIFDTITSKLPPPSQVEEEYKHLEEEVIDMYNKAETEIKEMHKIPYDEEDIAKMDMDVERILENYNNLLELLEVKEELKETLEEIYYIAPPDLIKILEITKKYFDNDTCARYFLKRNPFGISEEGKEFGESYGGEEGIKT